MSKLNKKILVTGAAGFIGAALVKKLIKEGEIVIGVDNINKNYDKNQKRRRLLEIANLEQTNSKNWFFYEFSIVDKDYLNEVFKKYEPDVRHLRRWRKISIQILLNIFKAI